MAKSYNNNEDIGGISSGNTHNVTCDSCLSRHIYSDRYKCLQCTDYDLCGHCFEERRQSKSHLTGHAMVHFKIPKELFGQNISNSNEVTLSKLQKLFENKQHNTHCNGCSRNIIGIRFKCDTCHNYNLCLNCMQKGTVSKNHQNTHPLVVTDNRSLLKIDVNDIVKNEVLGRGAFGQVYKAVWLSKNREVACKVIQVTAHRRHLEESFRKELNAYAELSGAYILKTFGYGERLLASGIKECYLITELMYRGSLSNVIHQGTEKISLRRKLAMACHIASGMRKLHAHTMIHRDIRPDNILVSSNYTAKIGDMGIAHVFDPNEKHTLAGCLPFMPPEFYRGDGQYDQSLDVFTFGLTLNELFTEKPHRFVQSTQRVQLTAQSAIFSDLINQCIRDESTQRPKAAELEDLLNNCRRAADKYIKEKHTDYSSQSLATKDSLFKKFYEDYIKLQKEVPKTTYSNPPKPHFSSDLVRQYFEDIMKQFHDVPRRLGIRRAKNQQPEPSDFKIMKYFDEENVNEPDRVIKPERIKPNVRIIRCPSPPSNVPRSPQANEEHLIHIRKNPRARTPNPISPCVNDQVHQQHIFHRRDHVRSASANRHVIQRHVEFHWQGNADRVPCDIHRLIREFK